MKGYHFIGVGGIGMSALAHILLERGVPISGYDQKPSSMLKQLAQGGAQVSTEVVPLKPGTPVVYSSAIRKDHPQYREASQLGIPLMHRSELLAHLMQGKKPLLVGGTHGKTTTSALLSHVLSVAGYDPSFAIGGMPLNFSSNGHDGSGTYFVAEADESDGSFLNYDPEGAILTNIEIDHLDYWHTKEALHAGFKQFLLKVKNPSLLFWCADDPVLSHFNLRGTSYGFSPDSALAILRYDHVEAGSEFDIAFEGKVFSHLNIPLIGKHHAYNASAVFGLAFRLGVPEETIRKAFSSFRGVKRRLEWRGILNGIAMYDDYAHHPTEIQVTLKAFKQQMASKRVVAIFQPHRFTRTKDCFTDFCHSFSSADEVILTEIYSAGEAPLPGISSLELLRHMDRPAHFVERKDLSKFVKAFMRHNDVILTLGAGDITTLADELLA